MPPKSFDFDTLPQGCVFQILEKCSVEDLLRFQCVAHICYSLGRDPILFAAKLSNLGIELKEPSKLNYESAIGVFRHDELPFGALLTDGGVLWGETWADNMFIHNAREYYCSDRLYRDVRCIAVHTDFEPLRDYALRRVTPPQGDKQLVYDNGLVEEILTQEDYEDGLENQGRRCAIDETNQIPVVAKIAIGRMGNLTCPVASSVILLGRVDLNAGADDGEKLITGLYSHAQEPLVEAFSGCSDLTSLFDCMEDSKIPKPSLVTWGINAEWVEFEKGDDGRNGKFLPAAWFRFHNAQEYLSDLNPQQTSVEVLRRHAIAVKCNLHGIDCRSMLPHAIPGSPQSIQSTSTNNNWLLDGRDYLEMPLQKPCPGNVACIIFSSAENTNDDDPDNIEVNFVRFFGGVVDGVQ
ncbi:hypothetical protein BSKO_12373 [Bryopsis sp. KO-2023]|nr:hypothetical protein BSKO_12373 [Bryopsis sp. KO-2023]